MGVDQTIQYLNNVILPMLERNGKPTAAFLLRHWLGRSGSTITFASSTISSLHDFNGQLYITDRQKFINGTINRLRANGRPNRINFSTTWEDGFSDRLGSDMYLAVGKISYQSKVEIEATKIVGTPFYAYYNMRIISWKFKTWDRYDWDPEKSTLYYVNRNDMVAVENAGRARQFDVKTPDNADVIEYPRQLKQSTVIYV
ncbi:hypothetical protein [Armatimonas sp.]|uniref:hypothetical protein n=1 Tax=Armatimonas sp. TaxID=1872638 RepID=UPI00374D7472